MCIPAHHKNGPGASLRPHRRDSNKPSPRTAGCRTFHPRTFIGRVVTLVQRRKGTLNVAVVLPFLERLQHNKHVTSAPLAAIVLKVRDVGALAIRPALLGRPQRAAAPASVITYDAVQELDVCASAEHIPHYERSVLLRPLPNDPRRFVR